MVNKDIWQDWYDNLFNIIHMRNGETSDTHLVLFMGEQFVSEQKLLLVRNAVLQHHSIWILWHVYLEFIC